MAMCFRLSPLAHWLITRQPTNSFDVCMTHVASMTWPHSWSMQCVRRLTHFMIIIFRSSTTYEIILKKRHTHYTYSYTHIIRYVNKYIYICICIYLSIIYLSIYMKNIYTYIYIYTYVNTYILFMSCIYYDIMIPVQWCCSVRHLL